MVKRDTDAEQDIEQALAYAECRAEGHQWRHQKGFVGSDDGRQPFGLIHGVIGKLARCSDCKMERIKWYTRSGQIFCAPRYYRPKGYSLSGDAKLTNTEWRRAWLVRELGEDLDAVVKA